MSRRQTRPATKPTDPLDELWPVISSSGAEASGSAAAVEARAASKPAISAMTSARSPGANECNPPGRMAQVAHSGVERSNTTTRTPSDTGARSAETSPRVTTALRRSGSVARTSASLPPSAARIPRAMSDLDPRATAAIKASYRPKSTVAKGVGQGRLTAYEIAQISSSVRTTDDTLDINSWAKTSIPKGRRCFR